MAPCSLETWLRASRRPCVRALSSNSTTLRPSASFSAWKAAVRFRRALSVQSAFGSCSPPAVSSDNSTSTGMRTMRGCPAGRLNAVICEFEWVAQPTSATTASAATINLENTNEPPFSDVTLRAPSSYCRIRCSQSTWSCSIHACQRQADAVSLQPASLRGKRRHDGTSTLVGRHFPGVSRGRYPSGRLCPRCRAHAADQSLPRRQCDPRHRPHHRGGGRGAARRRLARRAPRRAPHAEPRRRQLPQHPVPPPPLPVPAALDRDDARPVGRVQPVAGADGTEYPPDAAPRPHPPPSRPPGC